MRSRVLVEFRRGLGKLIKLSGMLSTKERGVDDVKTFWGNLKKATYAAKCHVDPCHSGMCHTSNIIIAGKDRFKRNSDKVDTGTLEDNFK